MATQWFQLSKRASFKILTPVVGKLRHCVFIFYKEVNYTGLP